MTADQGEDQRRWGLLREQLPVWVTKEPQLTQLPEQLGVETSTAGSHNEGSREEPDGTCTSREPGPRATRAAGPGSEDRA